MFICLNPDREFNAPSPSHLDRISAVGSQLSSIPALKKRSESNKCIAAESSPSCTHLKATTPQIKPQQLHEFQSTILQHESQSAQGLHRFTVASPSPRRLRFNSSSPFLPPVSSSPNPSNPGVRVFPGVPFLILRQLPQPASRSQAPSNHRKLPGIFIVSLLHLRSQAPSNHRNLPTSIIIKISGVILILRQPFFVRPYASSTGAQQIISGPSSSSQSTSPRPDHHNRSQSSSAFQIGNKTPTGIANLQRILPSVEDRIRKLQIRTNRKNDPVNHGVSFRIPF